jgi:Secretion system C-terminal sorting domain
VHKEEIQGDASLQLLVYPNPTDHSVVHLRSTGIAAQGHYNLAVLDVRGQLLKNTSGSFQDGQIKQTLDISDLAPGIYHLRIRHQGGQNSVSLVKQ